MAGTSRSSKAVPALLALLLVAGASPPIAHADTPASAPPLARSLQGPARDDYDAGRELYAHGDFAGATVKFGSAYDRSHDVRLLWNMASCEQRLRHYARARRLLERYLASPDTSVTADDRREGERVLKTISSFVSAVKVTSHPDGAQVLVDGERAGTTPLDGPLYVDLGKHQIVIEKDGFATERRELSAAGSEDLSLDVTLEPHPHEGTLEIHASSGDVLSLDGKTVGVGSVSTTVPSGRHTLHVVEDGGGGARDIAVVIEDDRTKTIDLQHVPSHGSRTWLYVAGGAALATVAVVGAYFLFRPSPAPSSSSTPSGSLATVDLP